MPLDRDRFRSALGRFASGVTVLTMRDADGKDHGMTATAFSSLSLDPPLVLVCVDRSASMAGPLEGATHLAVNLLAHGQEDVSRRFAEKDVDRFAGVEVVRGIGEVPLIDGAIAHLECRIHARHPGGDHVIVVGEVLDARAHEGEPLIYHRGRYGRVVA
ncbi:MAG: flavin reductase family protein [Gemmatimonadetes bacterium]|nr:flavin reductase family protein [Gemmatimonadota bacterium]